MCLVFWWIVWFHCWVFIIVISIETVNTECDIINHLLLVAHHLNWVTCHSLEDCLWRCGFQVGLWQPRRLEGPSNLTHMFAVVLGVESHAWWLASCSHLPRGQTNLPTWWSWGRSQEYLRKSGPVCYILLVKAICKVSSESWGKETKWPFYGKSYKITLQISSYQKGCSCLGKWPFLGAHRLFFFFLRYCGLNPELFNHWTQPF